MRNVDGLVSTLCALAREHGEDKKRLPIRAAALQALAAMVHSSTYLLRRSAFLKQFFFVFSRFIIRFVEGLSFQMNNRQRLRHGRSAARISASVRGRSC